MRNIEFGCAEVSRNQGDFSLIGDVTQSSHWDAQSQRRYKGPFSVFHLHHASGVVSVTPPAPTNRGGVWQKLCKVS